MYRFEWVEIGGIAIGKFITNPTHLAKDSQFIPCSWCLSPFRPVPQFPSSPASQFCLGHFDLGSDAIPVIDVHNFAHLHT